MNQTFDSVDALGGDDPIIHAVVVTLDMTPDRNKKEILRQQMLVAFRERQTNIKIS